MKKPSLLLFIGLSALFVTTLTAQPTIIQHGNLRWRMTGKGIPITSGVWLELQSENGWAPLVFKPALWIGGTSPDDDIVVLNTAFGGQPRLAGSQDTLNKVWTVTAEEIARHRADFADNGVIDDPITAIFSWPARGNQFFNESNGLALPIEDIERLGAGYSDLDGTGTYSPDSGDFPVLPVSGCNTNIIPTAIHYCVFTVIRTSMMGTTMPFEIHLYSFALGCTEEDHPLNQTMFTLQKVIYTTEELPGDLPIFSNCYLGQWVDTDLGCHYDDYVGSFPERHAAFAYNANPEDCIYGSEPTFGEHPPAVGIDVLRGPLDMQSTLVPLNNIMYYNNAGVGAPSPGTTDPGNTLEYYNYLRGYWRDGSALTVGGSGYDTGPETASFAFPGLPEQAGGWTEWEAQNPPGDRRLVLNYGDFSLVPGAVNEIITAYTAYNGEGDHLEQVSGLRDQIDVVQSYFDACFDVNLMPELPTCTAISTHVTTPESVRGLSIAPNPATDWLDLKLPANEAHLCTLRDLHGRVVFQQILAPGHQRLLLPTLPGGIYVLSAQAGIGQPMIAKVMIAR